MSPGDRDYSRELYPFLYRESDGSPGVSAAAVDEARASTLRKCADIVALRLQLRDEYAGELGRAAAQMAASFQRGGKLLAFGNGGSATDANDAAADCMAPPVRHWRSLPAISLCTDIGVVTGVANDVGFESAFSRQVIALGEPNDIALGFTTSGSSRSVTAALSEARRRGMITVALSGNDGGAVLKSRVADHCFVARLEYVPRIQEGHATVWHALLELVHVVLGDDTLARSA